MIFIAAGNHWLLNTSLLFQRNKTDLSTGDYEEESTMLEDSVLPSRATYLQHQTNKQKMPSSGSVALPAVMRTGGQGKIQKVSWAKGHRSGCSMLS